MSGGKPLWPMLRELGHSLNGWAEISGGLGGGDNEVIE
jgi:hypothetical protein